MNIKVYILESIKYILRSYPFIRKDLKQLQKLYDMNEQERKEYENYAFLRVFRAAIRKSPFYKELYANHGIKEADIQSINDIYKLPIITKAQIKRCSDKLLTVPKWRVKKAHTSGTTGEPLTVYDTFSVIRKNRALVYDFYRYNGFTYGKDRLVSIRGFLGRDDIKLHVHVAKTLYLSSYNIRNSSVQMYYDSIKKFKPKAITGYPSSLYNLALFMKDNKLKLEIPLCFTSSETLFDYQRLLISDVLNTSIYDLYGQTERACTLFQMKPDGGYYTPPCCANVELYKSYIVGTSLMNTTFPMIRYQVNDVIKPLEDNNILECRNQKVWIKNIEGRIESCIICKDGSKIGRLDFLFKSSGNVKQAQIVQKKDGEMIVNIVVADGANIKEEISLIEQVIKYRIGLENIDSKVCVVSPNEIIYTERNKFSQIISLL